MTVYFGALGFPPTLASEWPFTATRVGSQQLDSLLGSGLAGFAGLVGGRTGFTDERGRFNLRLWKQELLKVDFHKVKALVRSGELRWVYAIDEPHDWPGGGPSFEDIDAACAFVSQRWPGLKCGVNTPASWLKAGAAKLTHLGFLFFQWSSRRGDPVAWLAKQMLDARWFHGDVFLSIQILTPRLTPAQARDVAKAFSAAHPTGVMLWKWDAEWFEQSGAKEAMREVVA